MFELHNLEKAYNFPTNFSRDFSKAIIFILENAIMNSTNTGGRVHFVLVYDTVVYFCCFIKNNIYSTLYQSQKHHLFIF